MTWSAFLVALRRGVSEKTGAAARRGGVQQANRAASTKAMLGVPSEKHPPPLESWDFMMLDVSILQQSFLSCGVQNHMNHMAAHE